MDGWNCILLAPIHLQDLVTQIGRQWRTDPSIQLRLLMIQALHRFGSHHIFAWHVASLAVPCNPFDNQKWNRGHNVLKSSRRKKAFPQHSQIAIRSMSDNLAMASKLIVLLIFCFDKHTKPIKATYSHSRESKKVLHLIRKEPDSNLS
jgi:hypothetical protein